MYLSRINGKFTKYHKHIFTPIIFLLTIQSANAAIITFEDKSDFLAETGATTATGPLPDLGEVFPPTTIGSVTFTLEPPATRLFVGTSNVSVPITGNDWTERLTGNEIAITGPENLKVEFSNPVFSFGFDFVEPENDSNVGATFIDSTFEVTLKNLGTLVDQFSFNAPNDKAAFIGVLSNSPFDSVEIIETVGGIENEFYGEFFTGSKSAELTQIPEPITIWGSIVTFGLSFVMKKKTSV